MEVKEMRIGLLVASLYVSCILVAGYILSYYFPSPLSERSRELMLLTSATIAGFMFGILVFAREKSYKAMFKEMGKAASTLYVGSILIIGMTSVSALTSYLTLLGLRFDFLDWALACNYGFELIAPVILIVIYAALSK